MPRSAMRAPEFWRRNGALAAALGPVAMLWAAGAALRARVARPWRAPVPVICIGNLVAGGAGKTPLVIAVARHLAARGRAPHIIARGYGGRLAGPARVDPARHSAAEAGDEPLLLAAAAPAWIARDRAAGARAAIAAGAGLLVLDDGFQNNALARDLSLLAVDGGYGFGNGRVMPAGPLREPLAGGLARADAVVIIGADTVNAAALLPPRLPVYNARAVPLPGAADDIAGRAVFAFAGIGRPAKFYATLREMGCDIRGTRDFADHHPFTAEEAMALCEAAAALNAVPVTTEKDAVRLPMPARAMVRVLPVVLEWEEADALDRLLAPVLADTPSLAAHG
jgi:tetraacyldisaccharide 4'-kinase